MRGPFPPLTCARNPHLSVMSAGWMAAALVRDCGAKPLDAHRAEESPGSMETRCRITSGGGDPRESATESKPPAFARVRVKGCGKSAPRGW